MDDLRKLQLEELKILKMFRDICEENNLRYFLLGGTLLGAIRHDGFIPGMMMWMYVCQERIMRSS